MSKGDHVMLDLETADVAGSAVILSVGLVAFNSNCIHRELYLVPNRQQQIDAGRTISFNTLQWWMKQEKKAQAVFYESEISVEDALQQMHDFFKETDGKVWGNGANFDPVIITHLFNQFSLSAPFPFWKVRCFRSVCEEMGQKYSGKKDVTHNALQDAKDQANHLITIWNKPKFEPTTPTFVSNSFKIGARK